MDKKTIDIVVISLESAVERRRAMTAMLENWRHAWSYFDAHRSLANPGLSFDPQESRRKHRRELTAPEIACYSSHFTVIENFVKEGRADFLLVLEDDILMDVDFPLQDLCDLCEEREIDYIRLYGRYPTEAVRLEFFKDRTIIRHRTSPTGTQAYLLSKRGAKLFTEKFRQVNTTIDHALDKFWESRMPLYSVFPYPVIERYTPTSIPIPLKGERGALTPGDELAWKCNRAIAKAKKIYANLRLRAADARMQKLSPAFRQVTSQS